MPILKLCACDCGQPVAKEGNRFINHHYVRTEESKRKSAEWHQEKKLSEESIRKRTESRKGYKHSSETKSKIKQSVKTSWLDPDHKLRVINSVKESWEISRECRSGENHWFWKGGISCEAYGTEFNNSLKEKIRERDDRRCQYCDLEEKKNRRKLDVHHINYDKKDSKENNLISLCYDCHRKTNFNREYWERYYKKFAIEKSIEAYLMEVKQVVSV